MGVVERFVALGLRQRLFVPSLPGGTHRHRCVGGQELPLKRSPT